MISINQHFALYNSLTRKNVNAFAYFRNVYQPTNLKVESLTSTTACLFTTTTTTSIIYELSEIKIERYYINDKGESFVTSLFTFCFINIHFQVEKERR